MRFETPVQRSVYDRIRVWMEEIFAEAATPRKDAPLFDVPVGSAWATVAVLPWGEDETVVNTRAYVVRGARVDGDLLTMLLQTNEQLFFGAFGMDSEGDIFLQHSLLGSTCDADDLQTAVVAVVSTADEFDDLIVERWGGQRALDRYRELEEREKAERRRREGRGGP